MTHYAKRFFGNLESEVINYIAGLSTPLNADQIQYINTFVRALKNGLGITSLSTYFDVMYILAGQTSEAALRNLVSTSYYATAQGSPTFTQYEGYTAANNKYLSTAYNLNSNGSALATNSASMGVYSRTSVKEDKMCVGATDGTYFSQLSPYGSVNNCAMALNQGGTLGSQPASASSQGMYIASKTASGSITMYRNGSSFGTRTNTTDGKPNANLYMLCRNNNGTAEQFTTRQISFVFAGNGLTSGEVTIITNAIEAYMDANGKGVIT